eukprot:4976738-Lingulodinium_polyedra.AAC.1
MDGSRTWRPSTGATSANGQNWDAGQTLLHGIGGIDGHWDAGKERTVAVLHGRPPACPIG